MQPYDIMSSIIIVGIVLVLLRTAYFLTGSLRARRWEEYTEDRQIAQHPFVSVIVPARNEEATIAECIRSILANTYPHYELIVVDDQSTDSTLAIVQSLKERIAPNLKIISTTGSMGNLTGKARALAAGFEAAHGEIFLVTDADCRVPPTWIETLCAPFTNPQIGFVASFVAVQAERWFEKFQQIEWLFNNTLARASLAWGIPLGCFGNNIAIRKSAYERIGGFQNIPYSLLTEDLALLLSVCQTEYRCVYLLTPKAYVFTYPVANLRAYLRQHYRWIHGGKALGWKGWLFVFVTYLFWITIAMSSLLNGWYPLLLFVGKLSLDAALLVPSIVRLKKTELLHPSTLLHLAILQLLELSLPFLLIPQQIEWKNRPISTFHNSTRKE